VSFSSAERLEERLIEVFKHRDYGHAARLHHLAYVESLTESHQRYIHSELELHVHAVGGFIGGQPGEWCIMYRRTPVDRHGTSTVRSAK
jgi:hypothetical protein